MLAVWKKSPSVFEPNYFRSVLQRNGIERSLDEVRSFVEQQRKNAEEELRRLFYDENYFFGRDKL